MGKNVLLWAGAGQLGHAIVRRVGYGRKIVVGDKNLAAAQERADRMNIAGYDVTAVELDLADKSSILNFIAEGQKYGEIEMLVSAAGVAPSKANVMSIMHVDLYGVAVLLEEVGKVIKEGGSGIHISSQAGFRLPQLKAEQDEAFATTPVEELLNLDFLKPGNIRGSFHAYQLAKRCNEKRVMYEATRWAKRGARINDIAPGFIMSPLMHAEMEGPRKKYYDDMLEHMPVGRPGTVDEVANLAELLLSDRGAFCSGSTFLVDGGATASYLYGEAESEEVYNM